jgi:hypothetical protein
MSKKLKKLGKVAAGLGAAYALSKMGDGPMDGTEGVFPETKGYLSKFTKLKPGDKNPTMPYKSKKSGKVIAERFGDMYSPKKGGYIKAKNGTMVSKGQGMVMRPKKTIIS